MALQSFVGPWPLPQFRNLSYTEGRTPWTSFQTVARPLPTHRAIQTQNKSKHRHQLLEWGSFFILFIMFAHASWQCLRWTSGKSRHCLRSHAKLLPLLPSRSSFGAVISAVVMRVTRKERHAYISVVFFLLYGNWAVFVKQNVGGLKISCSHCRTIHTLPKLDRDSNANKHGGNDNTYLF
jgi:hypothetical protein